MSEPEGEAPRTSPAGAAPRVGAIAAVLAASIALSRVIGYVREAVLANQLGVGPAADAYRAAFQLPDLLNYLLAGGALSVAFIPLYSRTREGEGESEAGRLYGNVLGCVTFAACLFTVVAWWQADAFVAWWYGGFDPETQRLTVRLTRIVLPAQIFFLSGGIVRAVLMARGKFAAHAAAPLLYNVGIIAGGAVFGTAEGFAWGVLVGAFLGPFLLPVLSARDVAWPSLRLAPLDRDFRAYFALALPLMLGLGLTTVDEWFERFFGSRLAAGAVAELAYARLLMLAPVGVIGQAFAVAILPSLSRMHALGQSEALEELFLRSLRQALGLGLLAAAATFVFAEPAVELLYRHGAFTSEAARGVTQLLQLFAFAIPGWVLQQVAVRGFYAREEMWRAMGLSTAIALAAFPFYAAMADAYGTAGLAAAAAVAIGINAAGTLAWLRMRYAGPALRPLLASGARAGGAALLAAALGSVAVGWVLRSYEATAGADGAAIAALIGGGLAFLVGASGGVALFGDEALRTALRRVGGRFAPRVGR